MLYICGFIEESINEGTGLRASIFISGCKHNCKGCFSPLTHNFKYGEEFTKEKQLQIIHRIKQNPLLDGVSFLGGDPFFSAKELNDFISLLKENIKNVNIWCYTGFTFEQILESNNSDMINLLKNCDVLVDGKFIEELKDLTLPFRGSSNQRIIKIQESLSEGRIVLLEL